MILNASKPGYDILAQGFGGIMSLTGDPDGEPMKVGVGIADVVCGLYATTAILAALRHRDQTGQGQHIDLALADAQVSWLVNAGTNYLTSRNPQPRLGNQHPNIVPYQAFAASDGHLIVTVGNDTQFRHLCEALGEGEWAADPRFATNAQRVAHRELLVARLSERLIARPRDEWLVLLEAHGVPCGPINTLDQVFDDPQVIHNNLIVEWDLPNGETLLQAGPPGTFSATQPEFRPFIGVVGEHTEQILAELGHDAAAIESFRGAGVVA